MNKKYDMSQTNEKRVLITCSNGKGSGQPVHLRSLASNFAGASNNIGNQRKLKKKKKKKKKSQRSGPLDDCAHAFEGSQAERRCGPFSHRRLIWLTQGVEVSGKNFPFL